MTIIGILLIFVLFFVELCVVCNTDKTYLAEQDKPESDIEQRAAQRVRERAA